MSEAIGVLRSPIMIQFPVTPAEQLVLPTEDLHAFNQLRAGLHAEHCAATPTELFLVEELVQNTWRIRRFRLLEAATLDLPSPDIRSLALIERSLAAAERSCYRALAALGKLQKARGFVPSKSQQRPEPEQRARTESGFVPQKSKSARSQHLDWDEPFDFERFQAVKQKCLAEQKATKTQEVSG
jgi:hypothetical protein